MYTPYMDFDFLTPSGVKIRQSADGYRFTSDAVHLANFVKCKSTDVIIDAGCGGGVISLIVNDNHNPLKILAVDIQAAAAGLTRENAELNDFKNIEIFNADIREFHKTYGSNLADVMVCNPPYFSTGRKSQNPNRSTARHDDTLNLEELCTAATKLLKYGGELYFCYPSKYISRAVRIAENNNFRIRHLRFLQNEKGIYLALIHAKKGGGHQTEVTVKSVSDPC